MSVLRTNADGSIVVGPGNFQIPTVAPWWMKLLRIREGFVIYLQEKANGTDNSVVTVLIMVPWRWMTVPLAWYFFVTNGTRRSVFVERSINVAPFRRIA